MQREDDLFGKAWALSSHVSREMAQAALALARDIAKNGLGEGRPAHGFVLAVCDGEEMMRRDADGFPIYGEPHDGNIVFSSKRICLLGIAGADRRLVLAELTKDGMLLVDGRSGNFVASNYMVTELRRGETSGGARHKSASAMAQFDGGNFVVKASQDVCVAADKSGLELDVFRGTRSAAKVALVRPADGKIELAPVREAVHMEQLGAELARTRRAMRREIRKWRKAAEKLAARLRGRWRVKRW